MTPEHVDRIVRLSTEYGDEVVGRLEPLLTAERAALLALTEDERPTDVIMLAIIGRLFVREMLGQTERYGADADYLRMSMMLSMLVGPSGPLAAELRRELGKRVAA